jgi:hypothetical protein
VYLGKGKYATTGASDDDGDDSEVGMDYYGDSDSDSDSDSDKNNVNGNNGGVDPAEEEL